MYYNSPQERRHSVVAHDRIVDAIERRDADALVGELDAHRSRALEILAGILKPN
jgi:DNA-binding GntR family transcriptional regulator